MNLDIDEQIRRVSTRIGKLIVISGPSGAGKGTLVKAIFPRLKNLTLSVSMTTRTPRPGEKHAENYFFSTRTEFEALIAEAAFLEYATYNGNYYGTPRAFVLEQLRAGQDVILEIDVQGARQIRANWPEQVVQIFILPPSQQVLRERLEQRKTETPEVIDQRLQKFAGELAELEYYDYYVINDKLSEAVEDLVAVIRAEQLSIKAEECAKTA